MSKRAKTTGAVLAMALVAATGAASAQGYYDDAGYRQADGVGAYSDYARVLRVDPVFVGGACRTDGRYRDGYYSDAGYGNGGYGDSGYYGDSSGYYGSNGYGYGSGGRYVQDGSGSQGGRTAATIVGTIVGAALGSQVGGGSARYATAAIGSAVGGIAGRQIYDSSHRTYPTGTVRVGEVQSCRPGSRERVDGYDVTYEYGGRQYVTRTRYNPGSRIRVRVDVRPEQ